MKRENNTTVESQKETIKKALDNYLEFRKAFCEKMGITPPAFKGLELFQE